MDLALIAKYSAIPFLVSSGGALLISHMGPKISLLDVPNERSSHMLPVPRGGGVGIWLAFLVAGVFFLQDVYFTVVAGSAGFLGLLEDRFAFSSRLRLSVQFVLAAFAVLLVKGCPASIAGMALFGFWMVFITGTANFYNFMDGINGIAGLTGVVGFALLALFSLLIAGDFTAALLSLTLLSACAGFLPFNFPGARVFMGDVGSVLLGFVFASLVVRLSSDVSIFMCLSMFIGTFYADALLTIYRRQRRRENLMAAHRSHLYQYLSNELAVPHWKVSLIYAIVQSIFGLLSVTAYMSGVHWQIVLFFAFGLLSILTYERIKRLEAVIPKVEKREK
jgi:Fuc2NAc and GlcNAc transferase